MAQKQRYLILPLEGIRLSDAAKISPLADLTLRQLDPKKGQPATLTRSLIRAAFPNSRSLAAGRTGAAVSPIKVIASIGEDSVKLVEAEPEMIAALRQRNPGVRVIEEKFCHPAIAPRPILPPRSASVKPAGSKQESLTIKVERPDGSSVAGAEIYAFRTSDDGLKRKTGPSGLATFTFATTPKKLQRVFVYHDEPGLWTFYKTNVAVSKGSVEIRLTSIDFTVADSLRHFHQPGTATHGAGVRVGVIDSGAPVDHPALKDAIEGGYNCVPGSSRKPDDFGPDGTHGTHVAGIIAARDVGAGMIGVAPASALRIYRVFEDGNTGSGSSFAVIDAIERAIQDHCDIINLSLGFDPGVTDDAVSDALKKARTHGILAIGAAGNDRRQDVSFPGSDDSCVGVSAAGKVGSFPVESTETADIDKPYGADTKNFLGAFSNVGQDLDVTGAGVGVVSTLPSGYGAMSGTSMACPAIAGVAARILSNRPDLQQMPRNAERSDALRKALIDAAKPLGFGIMFEGAGLSA